jgi:hypothetical protein
VVHLLCYQITQIGYVQDIPDLLSGPAKATIFKWVTKHMAQYPVTHESLLSMAHLPWPGNNTTAVTKTRHTIRVGVFAQEVLTGELGGTVE